MTAKVHLRPSSAIHLGQTRIACGRVIRWAPDDMAPVVVDFRTDGGTRIEATVHGALVTCAACLANMRRRSPSL